MKFALIMGMLLLLLPPLACAQYKTDAILGSASAITDIELSTNIQVVAEKIDYSLPKLVANFSNMVPRQYTNQDVKFTTIEPPAEQAGSGFLIEWTDAKEGILSLKIDADVATRRLMPEITDKIPFPLKQTLAEYTTPTKNIDSDNREIIKVASDLAAGEDDLYKVVVKLAEWTNENVQYNLSTMTEGISQPASWVLTKRQGVCADISELFIALNRALGIPARFVTGVAYTNLPLFAQRWGFHAWAEVYFQGYGWVPFDVTNEEYGYIDAGHIRFSAAADPSESKTSYERLGRNVRIVTSEPSISADIKQIGEPAEPDCENHGSAF